MITKNNDNRRRRKKRRKRRRRRRRKIVHLQKDGATLTEGRKGRS